MDPLLPIIGRALARFVGLGGRAAETAEVAGKAGRTAGRALETADATMVLADDAGKTIFDAGGGRVLRAGEVAEEDLRTVALSLKDEQVVRGLREADAGGTGASRATASRATGFAESADEATMRIVNGPYAPNAVHMPEVGSWRSNGAFVSKVTRNSGSDLYVEVDFAAARGAQRPLEISVAGAAEGKVPLPSLGGDSVLYSSEVPLGQNIRMFYDPSADTFRIIAPRGMSLKVHRSGKEIKGACLGRSATGELTIPASEIRSGGIRIAIGDGYRGYIYPARAGVAASVPEALPSSW